MTIALVGGAVALAPAATAVGQSACRSAIYNLPGHINANNVNLRSGPGTSYSSKGLLSKGTSLTWICYKPGTATTSAWDYVKIKSGIHKGTYGWVSARYWD
ncbi:SH3 domain-containing protein [Streptomyces sp. Go40/10]|uniref:SH3 domain-containing protein n=1 Tax=Streptomyces sp. Go40/10 TaxID=2825844 RepID=UPI001E4D0EDB|nr:SH3 domain-containing protein [Streptomyces sp. Go40/10]UFR07146.1 SH3 domain-containing protein [Streptomyces sp. Go40/10]